jgi:hypothetical protein
MYDVIKEMCSHIVAPVDTMGCNRAQLKEINLIVSLHLVIKNPPCNEMLGGRISPSQPLSLILSSQMNTLILVIIIKLAITKETFSEITFLSNFASSEIQIITYRAGHWVVFHQT